ncbi:MAG: hypothetical protein J6X38_07250 [Abditibacteriota bacterium]|nr:hypothetical protein [Abditibacteriota bacterium]
MYDKKKCVTMDCPVCGKFTFLSVEDAIDGDDDIEIIRMIEEQYNRPERCFACGWIYDSDQHDNPDLAEGENECSLNEYRKRYAEIIKDNPEYCWTEVAHPDIPHMCPVCGKYEFEYEGCFDICPYCGWEDDGLGETDPDTDFGGPNDLSLTDSRKRYQKLIAENPDYMWDEDRRG